MKCYYHNSVDAVSVCKKCNKSLCKECYDEGEDGYCQKCKHENYKAEIQAADIKNKHDNLHVIRNSIIAFAIGAFFGSWIGNFAASHDSSNYTWVFRIIFPLVYGYGFFSVYWGLKVISKLVDKVLQLGFILIIGWPILILLLFAACFIGVYTSIPMFIKHFIQYKHNKKKYKSASIQ